VRHENIEVPQKLFLDCVARLQRIRSEPDALGLQNLLLI